MYHLSPSIARRDHHNAVHRISSIRKGPRLPAYLSISNGRNFYLRGFNAQAHLNAIAYYQPAMRESADFCLLAQGELMIRMNEHFDWQVRLDYSFDARPPQAVKSTDLRYRTGMSLTF